MHRVNNLAREARRGGSAPVTPVSVLPAEQTGAVTAAMRSEQRRTLLAAIDELEPADREVLLLRAVEQRSQQTTGELLGISGDAVAMRLSRALRRLRAHLPDALAHDLGA